MGILLEVLGEGKSENIFRGYVGGDGGGKEGGYL